MLRTYSRPNHVLLLLPPNLLWLLTTLAVVTSSNYSLIKVGIKPKLGGQLAKVGIGFELGHRQYITMLSLLIWKSQKGTHSKCNETQIFLCRSRICSRILFWYCAQTQFHDSNMQMMWCEKKLMICFTFYTWIGTCTTLKIISLPRILFLTVCRSSFTTAAGKNNKTDACVQSCGWTEPEWFHKSSLCWNSQA